MPIDNLVLVLDAGASHDLGCDNKPLPLMQDWNIVLRRALDERDARLSGLVGIHEGDDGPTFEKALGDFLKWQGIFELAARFEPFGLDDPINYDMRPWRDQAEARAKMVVETLNRTLYEQFGSSRASDIAAAKAYGALLEAMDMNAGAMVTVATTNYDPAAELAFAELGRRPEIGDVAGPRSARLLDPEGLIGKCKEGRGTAVLHLHGKVGLYTQADGSVRVEPDSDPFNESAGTPTVVLPDPEKDPMLQSAIRALWTEFDNALGQATHVLVLGHSLHDRVLVEHICVQAGRARKAITVLPEADEDELARVGGLIPASTVISGRFGPHLQAPSEPLPFLGNLASWSGDARGVRP